jgi:hypothetical protein
MALRAFRLSVRTTPEGKMAIVAIATLPFFGSGLVRSAYRLPTEASLDGAMGVLVLAIVFTVVGVALGSASLAVRSLALERREEALRVFPAFRGALAVHHMASESVGSMSLYLIGGFTLLYAPTALVLPPGPWIGLPLALATTTAFSFIFGIRAYRIAVRAIEVRPQSARAVHVVTSVVALLGFIGMPILPKALLRQWPGLVESIGSVVNLSGSWIAVPIVVTVGLAAAALWASWREILDASEAPPPVIWNGVPVLGSGEHPSTFTPLVRRPRRRALVWRLFLAKDVLLPWSRRPARLLTEGLLTLAFLATGVALAVLAHQRTLAQAHTLSSLSVLAFSLVAISAISLYRGAGCVGVEAPMLPILKSGLGFRGLWAHKLGGALAATVPHGVLCAVALGVGIAAWGESSQLSAALLILGAAALSFPVLGVGIGFMFPRLDSSGGGMIPGSTFVGKAVGAGVMLYSSGVSLALVWMVAGGIMPRALLPSTVLVSTGLVLGVAGALSRFGILRLRRMEV